MNTIDTPSLTQLKKEVEIVIFLKARRVSFFVRNVRITVRRKRNNTVGR